IGKGVGIGGGILTLILALIFGGDVFSGGSTTTTSGGDLSPADSAREEPEVQFVSAVLDSAQKTWRQILPQYTDAKLVLFRDITESGCGVAQSTAGPFYCPQDHKVYIDLGFYDELKKKLGAG